MCHLKFPPIPIFRRKPLAKKKICSDKHIAGEGIETSQGVVLLSGEIACRVCGHSEIFEWPDTFEKKEDLEGIEALSLISAVAHSKNWIVQRVINDHDGKRAVFILCPTCLSLFFSATTPGAKTDS
jgi:hypothetical protein